MLEGIIQYLELQLSVLNIFHMVGLCEQVVEKDKFYPAKYQSNGNYQPAADFDFHRAQLYFRLLDRREGEPSMGEIGGETYRTIIYNLRAVGIAPKDFYGTDNAFIDDKLVSNICGLLSDQSPLILSQSLKAARVNITVSQSETKRDVVLTQEFNGTEFKNIPFEQVFFSIDFTVSITGSAECFQLWGCNDTETDFLELFRDKYCQTADPGLVTNSDTTYSAEVESGGTLILPNIVLLNTAGDNVGASPSVKNVVIPNVNWTDTDGSSNSTEYDRPITCTPGLTLQQQLNNTSASGILTALRAATPTGKDDEVQGLLLDAYTGDNDIMYGPYFGSSFSGPCSIDTDNTKIYIAQNGTGSIQVYDELTKTLTATYTGYADVLRMKLNHANTKIIMARRSSNRITIITTANVLSSSITVTLPFDACINDDELSVFWCDLSNVVKQTNLTGTLLASSTGITAGNEMRCVKNRFGTNEVWAGGNNGSTAGRLWKINKTGFAATAINITGNTVPVGNIISIAFIGVYAYISTIDTLYVINPTTYATVAETPMPGASNLLSTKLSTELSRCMYGLGLTKAYHIHTL